ncbi:MAG: M28 family peptidase, partial [Planctomycetaceae bacterium]
MPKRHASHAQQPLDLALQMIAIPGKSGEEKAIGDFIVERLKTWGVKPSGIRFDSAHRRSPHGGQIGNLIVKLPGTKRGPRRLLMAHMDTVPLCVGSKPVRDGSLIRSADSTTALGGDNRAGAAVVLNSVREILGQDRPYPPLTLLWTIQEEVGLVGARHVSLSALGNPRLCFNWDGGAPDTAVIAATGCHHLDVTIHGVASHAGAHPDLGVNALSVLSLAITELSQNGWLGRIRKGRQSGTS